MDDTSNASSLPVNPFDSPHSAGSYMSPRVANTSIPRTIGILNVVFGALLSLCGLFAFGQAALMFAMGPSLNRMMTEVRTTFETQSDESEQKIQELLELEEAAESEEDRASLKAEREAAEVELDQLKAIPEAFPGMVNPMTMISDPRIAVFGIVNEGTGLILNVLLVISGVGLIGFKEWARKLSLGVVGFKLVRLVVVTTYQILVIAPLMAAQMKGMMDAMAQQAGPGAPPMRGFGAMMTGMQSAGAVFWLIGGSIYPIIVLVCLTRERVKAACQGMVVSADSM